MDCCTVKLLFPIFVCETVGKYLNKNSKALFYINAISSLQCQEDCNIHRTKQHIPIIIFTNQFIPQSDNSLQIIVIVIIINKEMPYRHYYLILL
jgi:hypothetical protein